MKICETLYILYAWNDFDDVDVYFFSSKFREFVNSWTLEGQFLKRDNMTCDKCTDLFQK